MVKGLELFRQQFADFKDRYALIGGTASMLALEEAALEARATKDLDIVLCVEVLDASFATAFWAFVQAGGYQNQSHSSGKRNFYRFDKPSNSAYPAMLELFSRTPSGVILNAPTTLTPIPIDQDVESLSAILLDDDYYRLVFAGVRMIEDLPCVQTAHLIPMKAYAWLDLTRRKSAGEPVDTKNIKKHRNDVIRLFQLLAVDDAGEQIELPESVRNHLREFVDAMEIDAVFDPSTVVPRLGKPRIVEGLRRVYSL